MSIHQDYGKYILVCDRCDEELEPKVDFMDAVAQKREYGWKSKRVEGDWCDFCPACQI